MSGRWTKCFCSLKGCSNRLASGAMTPIIEVRTPGISILPSIIRASGTCSRLSVRSYWIPGSYAPTLSENHNSFLRLLKNKDFKEESMTQVALDAIGTSTTLESNKSPD
jgi:hypothetical protein